MKIGVIVEGQSEFTALPEISGQLCAETRANSVRVLHACYDPHGHPRQIVRGCRGAVKQLAGRKYDLAIVLIDRENRSLACNKIAELLEAEFVSGGFGIPIAVVVKNRCFENWLVADLDALRQQKARFDVTAGMARAVEPDRADQANAQDLLKRAAKKDAYGKVDDARRILAKATTTQIARHSRSFRCFLARMGHPDFQNGSCRPAAS